MTLYDEVQYPSRAFSQTHPERAAAIGTLLGLTPPAPATCRVLEVGCGSGWNLIPMAAELPGASFFGFDLAASAVEAAEGDACALGLANVRFEHLDLMDLPEDIGSFDYIIAHGFYSWVPAPVRLKLLEVCRRHLTPQGLAFISFNANPYGHVRRMWREMMLFHGREMNASNAGAALDESARLLRTLSAQWKLKPQLKFHAELLDGQIGAISAGGGNWFFHDDLGPHFEPMSIADFNSEVEAAGLRYASEALFEGLALDDVPGDDWMTREQTWDNLVFRGFHSSLICHSERTLERPIALEAFEKLRFAAPLTRTAPGVYRNEWTNSEGESDDPQTIAVLERLARAWPESVAFKDLQSPAATLRDLTFANVIEPCVSVRPLPRLKASDRPSAFGPARLQARRGKVVTNRLHGAIQLEQEPLRQLVIGLDGTRTIGELLPIAGREQLEWLYRAALIQ